MPALTNIALTDERPLFIAAGSVTAVIHYPQDDTLAIFNEKGRLLYVNATGWNVDPADALKKIIAAGAPLVAFPADGTTVNISPAAVTFVTLSQTDKDGSKGAIIGIKGYGRAETTEATEPQVAELLDAVRKVKTLNEFKPEEASSRWTVPDGLFMDPLSITRIDDAGDDKVFVHFAASGQLDVNLTPYSIGTFMPPRENTGVPRSAAEFGADFSLATRRRNALTDEMNTARADFIHHLGRQNPQLLSVSSPTQTNYVDVRAFDYIHFYNHEKSFALVLDAQGERRDSIQYAFNTAAERQAAYESLHEAKTGIKVPGAAAKKAGKTFSL